MAAAACMRSGQQPAIGGTLELGSELAAAREQGAFRVVFSAPQGEGQAVSEISVVFSRPLRALEVDAPPPPIEVKPPLSGKWLWVGGRALRFVPDVRVLPTATE